MSKEFSVAQASLIFIVCYLNHDSWHQLGLNSTVCCSETLLKASPGLQDHLRGAGRNPSTLAAEGSPLPEELLAGWRQGYIQQAGPDAELASRVAWDINYEQDKILGEAKQGQAGGWLQRENAAEPGQDSLIRLTVIDRAKARCKPAGRQVSLVPLILKGLVYISAPGI